MTTGKQKYIFSINRCVQSRIVFCKFSASFIDGFQGKVNYKGGKRVCGRLQSGCPAGMDGARPEESSLPVLPLPSGERTGVASRRSGISL